MCDEKTIFRRKQSLEASHRFIGRFKCIFATFAIMLSWGLLLSLAGCTTLSSTMTIFPESVLTVPSDSQTDEADGSGKNGSENGSEKNKAELDDRVDLRELVELAVKTTNESEETQSFWFAGYIKNGFENRTTTSMYEGVAMRPEQAYLVNGRIAAQPFIYYRWDDAKYIKRSNVWYRDEDDEQATLPFDPFGGYTDWLPFLESAKALPDEEILSNLSHVIEVRINAKDWIEQSTAPLFEDLKALLGEMAEVDEQTAEQSIEQSAEQMTEQRTDESSIERLDEQIAEASSIERPDGQTADSIGYFTDERTAAFNHVLENTIVKMTLWIGKENHVIYQYSTWIVMPLPGAGYIDQETYFRFYHYNDPSIPNHFQSPDRIERWVLDYEEQQREGKLKGEIEQ